MRPHSTHSDDEAGNGRRTAVFVIIIVAAVISMAAATAWLSPAYQYLSCASCHM